MDGFSAARAIRAYESSRDLSRKPIIAITASAMASDIAACLASGMDDHLAKVSIIDRLIV